MISWQLVLSNNIAWFIVASGVCFFYRKEAKLHESQVYAERRLRAELNREFMKVATELKTLRDREVNGSSS